MTNPIHLAGLAGSAVSGITKKITETINSKEVQRTARLQSQMGAASDCASCFQQVVAAYQEYQTVAQQERTNRRNIEAWEKATLTEIQAKRDFLISYLEQSFDERAKNFEFLFQSIDRAVTSGDNHQLGLLLEKVVELAKISPFKDLKDLSAVKAALHDPEHIWDL